MMINWREVKQRQQQVHATHVLQPIHKVMACAVGHVLVGNGCLFWENGDDGVLGG